MHDDSLSLGKYTTEFTKNSSQSKSKARFDIKFEGHNEDIIESYYWVFNFAYYTGKGYVTIKLEDYHYFSENSQFGTQLRQVKGGSIRTFQENFNQLIQLVKVHLLPLLKEVKQADFYNRWISKIVDNDKIVQEEVSKGGELSNNEKYNSAKRERDEAISHLKDKWVNEVEGGRMWQMSKSGAENGLDFTLLPQLFFGTNIENPLYELNKKGISLQEQLEKDIYGIDISTTAREQVAKHIYKFHLWLPTAIRDTQVTYKLKLASLRNIYSQIQMSINFMRPLLLEISRKTEGFEAGSFYHEFENENPDFVNLFDTSYSYVRNLGIRDFGLKERGQPWTIKHLEFSKYGLHLKENSKKNKDIIGGKYEGKTGYIIGQINKCSECGEEHKKKKCPECKKDKFKQFYEFIPTDKGPKDLDEDEYKKLKKDKKVLLSPDMLKKFPIMETEFIQKRRTEIVKTPQGPQQTPFMKNNIVFTAYAWNLYEIATYREKLKEKNLDLLETFIAEIKVVKDDLLMYLDELNPGPKEDEKEDSKKKNKKEEKTDYTIFTGPFQGIYEIVKPIMPHFAFPKQTKKEKEESANEKIKTEHLKMELSCMEDAWKVYSVYKKAHGFM